jgi:hypothetical protein
MLICPLFVLAVLTALFALSELTALAWRFKPTIAVAASPEIPALATANKPPTTTPA